MAEILTTNYKTDVLRRFYEDIESSNTYVFVSGIELGSIQATNSQVAKNSFLSKTLFGKKIRQEDVRYMIKYIPWANGDTYVQYDDTVDLEDERFYAVVGPTNNDTGDYRVYKCLFNNYGGEVSSPPNYDPAVGDQIYRTADGYVWKYLYAISLIEFEAYNALGYIPIVGTFESDPVANTSFLSSFSDIFIENKDINQGYEEILANIVGAVSPNEIQVTGATLRENVKYHANDYFIGQRLRATTVSANTFYYEVTDYEYDEGTQRGIFTVTPDPQPDNLGSAAIGITPFITITGDGTGASAVAEVDSGRINNIQVITAGSGYRNASAVVKDPLFDFDPEDTATTDVRAEIRPVLSPPGGHGYNLLDELKCKHFLLYGFITGDDNEQIGDTNTYNGIGIVKEPEFFPDPNANNAVIAQEIFDNRIAVTTDDIGFITANTIITQIDSNNETIFSGTVHELDFTSNTVYIAQYVGVYPNQPGSDISLDPALPFRTDTGVIITPNSPAANNIVTPLYKQQTGEVYYIEDFFPLERNPLSREEFKIVFEF